MASLLDLAHEILHAIFVEVHPADLGALSRTCGALNSYIKNNRILCKDIYLRHFDQPQQKPLEEEPKWETELQKLVSFQKLLESENANLKRANIESVCRTALDLLSTAIPDHHESLNTKFLSHHFDNVQNSDIFLFSSSLYQYAGGEDQIPAPLEVERQLSSKLHSYYGTSKEAMGRTRSRAAHPFARSKVYDLRGYNDYNLWGPFLDDGTMTTDWEKVEAIVVVLGFNLQQFSERCTSSLPLMWSTPFEGVAPNSYTPIPNMNILFQRETANTIKLIPQPPPVPQPEPSLEAMDPYGVTGTWRRVVCFLDYNDLYTFNFSYQIPSHTPRPPITTQEAIRLIQMNLRVTKIEPPGEEDGKALPVVHFTGTSNSMHTSWDPNANSRLRGTVRLTPSGDIRWTTLSVFHGEPRWRSESIQIGGLRSGRGVVGTWFDKDYDVNGPAGPTAFWKVTDDLCPRVEGDILESLGIFS